MTGNETVKYLKEKFQAGTHYAHISVVTKKQRIEVHHPVAEMVEELKALGFEISGYSAHKCWPMPEAENDTKTADQSMLFINQYTGNISYGPTSIAQAKFNEATNQYELPAGFEIPEWAL